MSGHTPGPWEIHGGHVNYRGESQFIRAGSAYIAAFPWVVPAGAARKERYAADIRLIAAAPDLLAAVERALAIEQSVTQGQERELREGYLEMLRAAIAKAEGAR